MKASVPTTANPIIALWSINASGALTVALAMMCACRPMIPAMSFYVWFSLLSLACGALNLWFWYSNRSTYSYSLRSLATGVASVCFAAGLFALPRTILDTAFVYALGIIVVSMSALSMWEVVRLSAELPDITRRIMCLKLCAVALAMVFVAGPLCGEKPLWACVSLALLCCGAAQLFLSAKFRLFNSQIC